MLTSAERTIPSQICCRYGSGSLTIFNGSEEIRHGGEFDTRAVIAFDVVLPNANDNQSTPSTLTPTAAPSPLPRVSLQVVILYDWYPQETGWSLVDEETGTTVYSSPAYSVVTPMRPVATDIDVLPGRSYRLTITDIAHDGLCCVYGEGSARIVLLAPDGTEGSTLWSSDGIFSGREVATVAVPS